MLNSKWVLVLAAVSCISTQASAAHIFFDKSAFDSSLGSYTTTNLRYSDDNMNSLVLDDKTIVTVPGYMYGQWDERLSASVSANVKKFGFYIAGTGFFRDPDLPSYLKISFLGATYTLPSYTGVPQFVGWIAPANTVVSFQYVNREVASNGITPGWLFFSSPFPDASTWMSMTLGFGALGLALRRKRRELRYGGKASSLRTNGEACA